MVGRLERRSARIVAALAVVAYWALAPACDSSSGGDPPTAGDDASLSDAGNLVGDADPPPDGQAEAGGNASASLSTITLDFSSLTCGGMPSTLPLKVNNSGAGMLAVSASTVGAGFTVTPTVLQVAPGGTGNLSVTASAGASATAGVKQYGSLELFTNDPLNPHMSVQLSGTPAGAVLSFATTSGRSFAFPATEVAVPASLVTLEVVNSGNQPGTFTISPPSDAHFAFVPGADGGSQTLNLAPGATYTLSAGFTPTNTSALTASASVTTGSTTTTCGGSLQSIEFSGQGAYGVVSGWPSTLDFGPASCGGAAPAKQTFTLSNTGSVDATVTAVTLSGAAFTTDMVVGRTIPPQGTHTVTVNAPAVAQNAPLSPITATLSIETDADTSPHLITLTEEPSGAVLAFDTSGTTNFGSFGPVVLLASSTEPFRVVNSGNQPADVTLSLTGGSGGATPFQVSTPSFTVVATSLQQEVLTFTPTSAPPVTGQLSITATGAICGSLPNALPLSGSGVGGSATISPTSLSFNAVCGGSAPAAQSFLIRNDGSADMNWSLGPVSGPGASTYSVLPNPPPGLLHPGGSATVVVTAAAVPSPAANTSPSAYAAQITVTTDVPLDPPHVVSLGETPLGDQLSFAVSGPVRFGQVPVGTSVPQTVAISNSANQGSAPANVTFQIAGGAGAYTISPTSVNGLPPGGHLSSGETVSFAPISPVPYSATLGLATTDPLCTPLPQPLPLSGTGTRGQLSVSAATLAFGTDPQDPAGLVNCGAVGTGRTLTLANVGNQAMQVTGLSMGKAGQSPFVLSGSAATLPLALGIGGSSTLTVTPSPIPASVANPNDPSLFSDTLTITTDTPQDSPHVVHLTMQARGAVIADTPLPTAWTFGTVTAGGIATFNSAIQNTGNAAALVRLNGLTLPSVFGLAGSPVTAAANAVTPVVGQFTPPSADGTWSDQGTLTVSAAQAFCAPLPASWNAPTINLSGSSSGNAAVTISGSLAFPGTECGGAVPGGQAVVLSNTTAQALGFTAQLSAGKFYSLSSGSGTIPAGSTASVVVSPHAVIPGPGVMPGSAPYADNLVVTVATSPPTTLTVPVSWTIDGAVLTLPQGSGPGGQGFYVADSTSGFPLPLGNTGTATASVSVAIQPSGSVFLTPNPPIAVIPGIGASPELVSSSTAPACPTTAPATLTFVYSGPVCQPLPLASVNVQACVGTY